MTEYTTAEYLQAQRVIKRRQKQGRGGFLTKKETWLLADAFTRQSETIRNQLAKISRLENTERRQADEIKALRIAGKVDEPR